MTRIILKIYFKEIKFSYSCPQRETIENPPYRKISNGNPDWSMKIRNWNGIYLFVCSFLFYEGGSFRFCHMKGFKDNCYVTDKHEILYLSIWKYQYELSMHTDSWLKLNLRIMSQKCPRLFFIAHANMLTMFWIWL